MKFYKMTPLLGVAAIVAGAFTAPAFADKTESLDCPITYAQLKVALQGVVLAGAPSAAGTSGGLNFPMWATVVNSSGQVCAVVNSNSGSGFDVINDGWLASRVISAQKANTANSLSTNSFALSTANLYTAVRPGGSLYGLQHSNPVDAEAAYKGNAANFGAANDPMNGKRIGGINVFGGGFALYSGGKKVGGLGISGDTSCTDHVVAWKVRDALGLDGVPAGPVTDTDAMAQGGGIWNHPVCINNPTNAQDAGSIVGN
jgi:uncharacterized protein GlcG (DUF336 family)